MSFYDDASLIMYPSGYKEDKIYSLKPTDGSGDLTFTRASTATRVNADGLIETSPVNLAQYSEDFSNAVWTKGATITSNVTTAPNGTATAEKISEALTFSFQNIFQTVSQQITQYTYSIYLKKAQNDRCVLFAGSSQALLWIDMTNWTSFAQTNVNSYAIDAVGNGWYRVQFSYTNTLSASHQTGINLVQNGTVNTVNYLGNTANGAFIWGAQLNIGATAKPYFPTTDRLNVPRIDYTGGGCGSLLLEKQSTNISNQSEDFSNWPTKVNVTTTANYATSPDGTTNASRLQFTGSGFMYGANGYSQTSGTVYTLSCWAKRNGSGSQSVGFFIDGSGSVDSAWSLTNEYQRFTYTYTAGNSSLVGISGASGADVSVWGWQFEASSYATSYIPTLASSVTRLADAAFKTGISSLIGQTEGTMFIEANFPSGYDGDNLVLTLSDNTELNLIFINRNIGRATFAIVAGGVVQLSFTQATVLSTGNHKIAFAYKQNDFAIYLDGVLIHTDTSGNVPACSKLNVGSYLTGALPYNDGINQAILFKTRLTNAQLATLTTL